MQAALCVVCAALLSATRAQEMEIFSDPSQGTGLTRGLRSLLPDMTLLLHEGTHRLQETVLVRDLRGVSLQGAGAADRVKITCPPSVGLAFFNTSGLRIRNVTIRRCGLNGESWDTILPLLHDSLTLTFGIPILLQVGLLVAVSTDVTLEDSVIERTRGIGFLGVTLLGSTRIRNVVFHDNGPAGGDCPDDITILFSLLRNQTRLIGGGAYILYQDLRSPSPTQAALHHELSVSGSQFTENRDCSAISLVESFVERSAELAELGYQVGAGGGLTVMMAQTTFAVETSISESEFSENVAIAGSGVHVGVFSGIPAVTKVTVSCCRFERNGINQLVSSGGGMIVNLDLVDPEREVEREVGVTEGGGGVYVDVRECVFERNMASSGGGVSVIAHYSEQYVFHSSYRARFHNCTFGMNQAYGGSAMLVYERKISGFEPGLQLAVSDTRFIRNSIRRTNDDNVDAGFINDYGVFHVRNVNVTLSGTNVFDRNMGTALGSVSSLIHVGGRAVFEKNKAVNGAGMKLLSESHLILLADARMSFINNRADLFGGAIYIERNSDNFTFVPEDCFLYFNQLGYGLCSDSAVCLPRNVSVLFKDNTARLGSLVYGSSLSTCPWVSSLIRESPTYNSSQTVYSNLRSYRRTLVYVTGQRGPPQFSTVTAKLVVESDPNISVMPGEQFFVNITTLDRFGHQIPEVVTSAVVLEGEEDSNASVMIGDFGFFEVRPMRQSRAPVTVLGEEGEREVTLLLTTIDLTSAVFVTVTLASCSVGFAHSNSRCVCDSRLASRGVSCDVNFTVDEDSWLGPVHDGHNVTNDELTVATCVLNYCGDGEREVRSGEWELQCRQSFHRTGRLCGACEEGYSVKLGTNACAHCTNWSLFLLPFFFLAGIFVVFVMGLLQISVAEGFFTATIFYSNIITLYAVYFNNNGISGVNFLTSFFSLNFGIPTCLYDGMDSLALVTLQLTFVAYLFLLAVLHIIMYKTTTFKFVDSFNQRYSPAKSFATLIILSYVSILQSSFGILSFTVVSRFDGERRVLWFMDPTVDYFSGFHVFLCVVAIILLFFLLPPPILFTVGTRAIYRWPYLNKLKPLYDALFAPYKTKFRPWLGFQIIFRIVLFINTYFVPTPHHLLVVAICLIVYLYLQTTLQPYKTRWANRFESTLIVNAILYVTVTLYFGNLSSVSEEARLLTVIFLSVVASCVIIAGFIRYFIEQNPKTCERVKNALKCRKRRRRGGKTGNGEGGIELHGPSRSLPHITFVDPVGNRTEEENGTLTRSVRSASVDYLNNLSELDKAQKVQEFEISYAEYREPLLDQGEVDVVNSYSVVISQNSSGAESPNRSRSPLRYLLKSVPAADSDIQPRPTA